MEWREFLILWGQVALQSFGGPAGQIAVMHQKIVEEKKLVSEEDFLAALNFCMLLPGPEAQQLATYLGRKTHGTLGGLIAGLLFILPGFVAILALSFLYLTGDQSVLVAGLFYGLKPAVVALVAQALWRIGKKTLHAKLSWAIAAGAFFLLWRLNTPFPLLLLLAALAGLWFNLPTRAHQVSAPPWRSTVKVASLGLACWLLPLAALVLLLGTQHPLAQLGLFFSQLSVMSFGGAYAALSYMAQQAVDVHQWVTPSQMLDGLAMAETTPGPLIMVVQFVGFLVAGVPGSLVAVWMTFAPCFLWIFTFSPYIDVLQTAARWQGALRGISAAVVGVIAHLSLWFTWQTLFPPEGLDYAASVILAVALLMQFVFRGPWWLILSVCATLGLVAMFL